MQYGAMNFPIMPLLEEIDLVADMGMDYLELAMDPPQAHYQQLRLQRSAIVKALTRRGLGLLCHLPSFLSTADLTESLRQASLAETVASLETAADLGARKVVLHPGYIRGLAAFIPDQALALGMQSLDRIYQKAQQLGLLVCIENLFASLGPYAEPEDFKPIFSAFPELRLVLDLGHAHIKDDNGDRIQRFINLWGDRLAHLHLSDNKGRYDEHLPLGQGSVPLAATAQALVKIGYNDTATLEIFGERGGILPRSREFFDALLRQ